MIARNDLVACEFCDLLHERTVLTAGSAARCARCGGLLGRRPGSSLDKTLSLAMTGFIALLLAVTQPLLSLNINGQHTSATFLDAVMRLWDDGMPEVAVVVLATAVMCPAIELMVICYLLTPLRASRLPPGFTQLMRLLHVVAPWGMLEVFVLGVLVCMAKLWTIASIQPGVGLWSFGVLALCLIGAATTFDAAALWDRALEVAGGRNRLYAARARLMRRAWRHEQR